MAALAPLLNAVVFNADPVRANLSRDLDFSHQDRIEHARRMGWMCGNQKPLRVQHVRRFIQQSRDLCLGRRWMSKVMRERLSTSSLGSKANSATGPFATLEKMLASFRQVRIRHSLADRSIRGCFVIDMSVSGVAVSAQLQPEIGVGSCIGRVVRLLPDGFKFVETQNRHHLDRLIGRAATRQFSSA
jgi:hypothetical protein